MCGDDIVATTAVFGTCAIRDDPPQRMIHSVVLGKDPIQSTVVPPAGGAPSGLTFIYQIHISYRELYYNSLSRVHVSLTGPHVCTTGPF